MFWTVLYIVIGLIALAVIVLFLMGLVMALSFNKGDIQLEYLDDIYDDLNGEYEVRPLLGVVSPNKKENK